MNGHAGNEFIQVTYSAVDTGVYGSAIAARDLRSPAEHQTNGEQLIVEVWSSNEDGVK